MSLGIGGEAVGSSIQQQFRVLFERARNANALASLLWPPDRAQSAALVRHVSVRPTRSSSAKRAPCRRRRMGGRAAEEGAPEKARSRGGPEQPWRFFHHRSGAFDQRVISWKIMRMRGAAHARRQDSAPADLCLVDRGWGSLRRDAARSSGSTEPVECSG